MFHLGEQVGNPAGGLRGVVGKTLTHEADIGIHRDARVTQRSLWSRGVGEQVIEGSGGRAGQRNGIVETRGFPV
jgi:hypothetical protein